LLVEVILANLDFTFSAFWETRQSLSKH